MRNYADQDYLHARIHALRGRLLLLRDYASMVREQQTSSAKLSGVHGLIEAKEMLFREQIAPVIGLAEAYDKYIPIFLAYLRQYEIHNAKILLAKAAGKESLEQWYDISPFAILEKDLLQKNLSLVDTKSLIANTYLADDFRDTSSSLRMEIQLDISAAGKLYHSSTLFSGEAKKEFQEMALRRMAVLTVIWTYRLKAYYHWNDEQIRSCLEKLNNLFGVNAQSQVRIAEEELNRHLEQLRKSGGQEPSVVDIERHLEQNYYDWVSFMFHRNFHSICCVVAYLWMLFYQIKNLFRIIDGRRFGLSAEAVINKMICNQ
jgi:vacuolar-type H+-ATPase subunit C/Vma6